MVFWFVLRAPSTVRFVEAVIEQLTAAGHTVRVSFALDDGDVRPPILDRLGIEVLPLDVGAPYSPVARRVAWARELLRNLASYATLRHRWLPLMRDRWLEYLPSKVGRAIRLLDAVGLGKLLDAQPVARFLTSMACLWPVPRSVRRQLAALAPDIVVASPIIFPGSLELEAVRAAHAAGVPTVGLVLSWDNLTSKGIFHVVPDRLFVWNDAQVREAVEWHGLDRERIEVLGAPAFDYLFEAMRRGNREEALSTLGLGAHDRYVVYGGSSRIGLGLGGEVAIVHALAAAVQAADWAGEPAPVVVVRPHPKNAVGWEGVENSGVRVWARPSFPDSDEAKRDLVATLAHADAVVGLNTTLFIDAAVLDRPAVAVLLDGGDLTDRAPSRLTHFAHLTQSGILELVADVDAAANALARLRRDGDSRTAARRIFVESFLRPRGLDRPAAAVVAERLASIR